MANINGEIILLSELREKTDLLREIGRQRGEPFGGSEREALRDMIDEKIVLFYAGEKEMKVPDAEVDQAVERIKERNGLTTAALEAALAAQGTTMEKLRGTLHDQILIQKVTGFEVGAPQVSDEEVRIEYERHPERYMTPARARARHIVLLAGERSSQAEFELAQKTAAQLLAELRAGADFAGVARKNSQDGSARLGGDLGWFGRGEMTPEFEQAVFSMKPGELRGPVRTQFGLHIIELLGREDPKPVPFEKAKESIRQALERQEYEQRRSAWMERLRGQAYIEVLY